MKLSQYTAYEDDIISKDIHAFPGWKAVSEAVTGIVEFENKEKEKLLVINANRKPLEKALGVDLIYYHRNYQAFTFVQYKMMDKQNGKSDEYYYNPNNTSHADELKRMNELQKLITDIPGSQRLSDYRFSQCPIFFKLCKKLQLKANDGSIAAGAYIPLNYWNILLVDESTKGPKGGCQMGYRTLRKRYDAIAALERATGKLDIILARDPTLALAPTNVSAATIEVVADTDKVKEIRKQAQKLLDGGQVQAARHLLEGLASETVISVSNIPLATYPDAIKQAAKLVDQDKPEEAKKVLQTALNTLVVTNTIIPLPVVATQELLKEAEKLAEKANRKEDENKRLADLLTKAHSNLEFAEVLGYGTKQDFKDLYAQLDQIKDKTSNGKSGTGFFAEIKSYLAGLVNSSQPAVQHWCVTRYLERSNSYYHLLIKMLCCEFGRPPANYSSNKIQMNPRKPLYT